ncbi:MAG: hypothetical protein JSU58_08810 [Dehalococcoidales bacterium]|nr:MAG: hypothetical protein JSU58_08810 [Dehalococcoidales bacterium]
MAQSENNDIEVREDLAFGQIVLITFRWLIIGGALIVTLWTIATPDANVGRQALIVFLLLVYAAVNFVLLARYLRRSRNLANVTYTMSLVDLILITVVIATGGDIYNSHIYVYYYPALMVLAVVFPVGLTVSYTLGVMIVYGLMISLSSGADFQGILARLLMMAGVAFCASLFRKIEHDRRTGKAKVFSISGGEPDRDT